MDEGIKILRKNIGFKKDLSEIGYSEEYFYFLKKMEPDFLIKNRSFYNVKFPEKESYNYNGKKIALCLSGSIRDFQHNFLFLKKFIIDPLNCDIFFHTWDNSGFQKYETKSDGSYSTFQTKDKADIKFVLDSLKPKMFLVENQDKKNIEIDKKIENKNFVIFGKKTRDGILTQSNPTAILSQLYSIYRSNLLKKEYEDKNNFKYDIVIKWRFDLIPLEIPDIFDFKNKNSIIIPKVPNSNHGHYSCDLCNIMKKPHKNICHSSDLCDVFAISNSENMDFYCDIFNKSLKLYKILYTKNIKKFKNAKVFSLSKNIKYCDIWNSKNEHEINCFYPERLFRYYLKDYFIEKKTVSCILERQAKTVFGIKEYYE